MKILLHTLVFCGLMAILACSNKDNSNQAAQYKALLAQYSATAGGTTTTTATQTALITVVTTSTATSTASAPR